LLFNCLHIWSFDGKIYISIFTEIFYLKIIQCIWVVLVRQTFCTHRSKYEAKLYCVNLSCHILLYSYIQQDTTLHSLFYLETAVYVLGDTITHHQERRQLYLQHLVFVRPLLLPAARAASSSNGVTNTRCCRYSCLRS
jgi:hypothetical protein